MAGTVAHRAATRTGPAEGATAASARLRPYLLPVLLALIALPVTGYAIWQSTTWIGIKFPGFLLMENAVVPTVSGFRWPPDRAAVFHAQVVAVDGQPVRSSTEVLDYLATRPLGTMVDYTLSRDGQLIHQTLPIRLFDRTDLLQTYGILFLFGCANLIIGLTVGFMQPRTAQGRVFALHTFVAAMYAITGVFLHHPAFHYLNRICLLVECLVSATFVHLALTFPVVRGTESRRIFGCRRVVLALSYLASLAVFALALRGFQHEPADLTGVHLAYSLIALGLMCVAVSMAYSFWENRDPHVRLQINAVLPGVMLACAVPFVVFLNNASAERDMPMQSGLLAALPFYFAVAYAIGKHDLFDIPRVVRLSVGYAFVTLIVLSGYILMLQVGALLLPASAELNTILGVIFVLLLAAALDPLRRGVQTLVDRMFYRKQLDWRASVRELSEVMTTLLDLREVVTQVTQRVAGAMQLESIAIALLGQPGEASTVWLSSAANQFVPRPEPAPELAALARLVEQNPEVFDPRALLVGHPDSAARAVGEFLDRTGTLALVPLMIRNRVTGVLLLGAKQSELPLDSEAIDLLRTLANQTAIAVENARSYQQLEELNQSLDAKVRQQTEELRSSNVELSRAYDELKDAQAQLVQSEKMASLGQLVAGVAHELNNPASFVHGGLANLAEYLGRFVQVLEAYEQAPIADGERAVAIAQLRKQVRLDYLLRETPELLRVCFEGSERITKIVEDLRVFARADSGARVGVQLSAGIDSTVRMLETRLAQAHIELERRYQPVAEVEADPGQLNQVWMNLLSNAIDALESVASARLVVTLRPAADGSSFLEVEVRDNGVGMSAEIQSRIFEPFFSTKAIGKGTGLGLAIAYGAVKSHGGTIAVESTPGTGTAIIVRLPSGASAKIARSAGAELSTP